MLDSDDPHFHVDAGPLGESIVIFGDMVLNIYNIAVVVRTQSYTTLEAPSGSFAKLPGNQCCCILDAFSSYSPFHSISSRWSLAVALLILPITLSILLFIALLLLMLVQLLFFLRRDSR